MGRIFGGIEDSSAPGGRPNMLPPGAGLVSSPLITGGDFVFIDDRVAGAQDLLNAAAPGTQVFVIDSTRDGLQQIADILSAHGASNLSAIQIISHGSAGAIEIGSTLLNDQTASAYADTLAAIGAALRPGGDIGLYACDVAQSTVGHHFIGQLATLTGADIAAATHDVGGVGGDWTLDASTGGVDSALPFAPDALTHIQAPLAIKFASASDPFPAISFGTRIVAADFNNDGKLDILYQDSNTAFGGIHLKLGNGDGTFQTAIDKTDGSGNAFSSGPLSGLNFSSVTHFSTFFPVDLNSDGKVDIIDDQGGSTAASVYQNGGGSYSLVSNPFGTQQFTGRFVFGDFNNDGYIDVLNQHGNTAGNGITLYLNNADGTIGFTAIAQPDGGSFGSGPFSGISLQTVTATTMLAVDLNGDGKTDLIANPGGSTVPVIYQNTGSGFTSVASPFPTQAFSGRFVLGDFNSDGYIDALNQTSNVSGSNITLYLNNANGSFTFTSIAKPDGANFSSGPFNGLTFGQLTATNYLVGDFDKDGDADIADSENNGTGSQYLVQGGDNFNHPPRLSSSTPSDNGSGVATTANIVLTFDEAVSKGTGNIQIIKTSDSSVFETIPVTDARVTGSGTTWTVNPTGTLAGSTAYAVRIAAGAFHNADGAIFFGINDNTTLNFTTAASNTAPVITGDGHTVGYTEQAAPITLESAIALSDDGANLASADVSLSGFLAGDELKISGATSGTIGAITYSYNAGTGTLSLTGTDTVAHYQAALRLVTFDSTSDNPTAGGLTTRDIGWSVSDGSLTSSPGSTTINITAVDDPKTATPDTGSTAADTVLNVNAASGLLNNDPDPDGGPASTIAHITVNGGTVVNAGTQAVLTDGSLLTVNADGSFSYDPNHKFDTLSNAGSGAADTTGTESFTYTITGGGTATVTLTINGVYSGNTIYVGTGGNDTITGGNSGNLFDLTGGGNDTATGGSGNDGFKLGGAFTSADRIDGGGGSNNQVQLDGAYGGTITLDGTAIKNIQVTAFGPTHDYTVVTSDSLVGAGQTFTFWSVSMSADHRVNIDGGAEIDGKFHFFMGSGDDTAKGGAGADLFYGEGGADTLTGNLGADTFAYLGVTDSTGSTNFRTYDVITDFTAGTDKIDLPAAVGGIDTALTAGALSTASFNADLAAAVGSGQLAVGHAVLFTPNTGTLATHTFLVVDANGTAGYQAGADFVFDVTGMTGSLATSDFI